MMARGDHLYYYRAHGAYSHHGLDVGDGTVIHYESSRWQKLVAMWASAEPPTVKRTSLADFSRGYEVLIQRYDDVAHVDDAETAVARAESYLGKRCDELFGNRCAHFVTWCKTGSVDWAQVSPHRRAVGAVVKGVPVGALLWCGARGIPGPLGGAARMGTVAAAGAVYARTFLRQRERNAEAGLTR